MVTGQAQLKSNKVFTGVLIMFSLGLIFSCSDYSLINRIDIKATPSINAPLGEININLLGPEGFDIDSLFGRLGNDAGAGIYRYRSGPDDKNVKMLLHFPIADIPLDFGEYLFQMGMLDGLSQALEVQEYNVPSFEATSTTFDFNIDIGQWIIETVNENQTQSSLDIVEPGSTTPGESTEDISLETEDFTELIFTSGALELSLGLTNASPTFTLEISKVALVSGESTVSENTEVHTLSSSNPNTVISLPLDSKTINDSATLEITFTPSGGTNGQTAQLSVHPQLATGSSINNATGVSFSETFTIGPIEHSLGAAQGFVEATIGTGSIEISSDELPSGWTGLTRSLDLNAVQVGGLTITESDLIDDTVTIDLVGQPFSSSPIDLTGAYTLTAANASFADLNSTTFDPSPTIIISIDSLSSVRLSLPADYTPSTSFNHDISHLSPWVSEIHFAEVGARVTLTNGLPAGNDIVITVSSTALGIFSQTKSFTPGEDPESHDYTQSNYTLDPDTTTNLDFSATVGLPNYDPGSKTITLSNIEPGASFTFGGSMELVNDWASISIAPDGGLSEGLFPNDGSGIDLSLLGDYLPQELSFEAIPIYLYLSGAPSSLNTSAHIDYAYTGSTGDLLGSSSSPVALHSVSSPRFQVDSDGYITRSLAPDSIPSSIQRPNLQAVVNARPDDLRLGYAVSMQSIDLVPTDLAALGGTNTLRIDMAILLPLAFTATSDAPLSIGSFDGQQGDLFGRSDFGPGSEASSSKFTNFLTGASLTATYNNTTGIPLEGIFRAYPGQETYGIDKEISLAAGTGELQIDFSQAELELIKGGSFAPEISLSIPQGSAPYQLSADAGISIKLGLSAHTNIEHTVDLGGSGGN